MFPTRWFFGLGAGGLAIATRRQSVRQVGALIANGFHRLLFGRRRRPPDENTSNQ